MATLISSLVLATSAAAVNNTVKNVRGSQERSEAVQMLRGKVELLRAAVATDAADDYLDTASKKVFCLDDANLAAGPVGLAGSNAISLTPLDTDTFTSPNPYPAVCLSGRYYVAIEKPADNSDTFAFHARWDGPNGHREEATMYYRLHKESAIVTPVPAGASCPLASTVSYTFDPGGPKAEFRSDKNRISGPSGVEPRQLGPVTLSLPPGGIPPWNNYTVTLTAYDTHDLGAPDNAPYEQYRVRLQDSSGRTTYTSPYTTDVPATIVDGVRQGPPDVFTGQAISAGTLSLIAEHIYKPHPDGNGFHVDTITISCP